MTPEAERRSLLRRIELHKQMGRGVPHKLAARLEEVTKAALAQKPKVRVKAEGRVS